MEEPVVKVEHLSHRYSIQWAVRDISFEIPRGGIYGLLGSNGAGKSTTMNIISGVIKQTEGQVFINGIDARKRPVDAKRHIGFLPQKPPLYGDLTVEEYLIHCARLRWVADKDLLPAVDEVLAKCGITHFRKRLIKNLSGGYQQRVGIAQAIVHKPDLVIFDEPTNGLDPNQIMEIRHLIHDIAKDRTVILSTHILTEVQAVCDRVIIINKGRIVATDTPDNLAKTAIKSNKLEIRVKGPKNDVLNGIAQIPGIKFAEIVRIREEGSVDVNIETEEDADVREAIFEFCSENHYPILLMKTTEVNLEDIFLQITGEREAKRA